MKRILFALLVPVVALATDAATRYSFSCHAPRREAVIQAADILARFDYRVTYANPEVGILAAERSRGNANLIVASIHLAADGDSVRILSSETTTMSDGKTYVEGSPIDGPLLNALRSLGS